MGTMGRTSHGAFTFLVVSRTPSTLLDALHEPFVDALVRCHPLKDCASKPVYRGYRGMGMPECGAEMSI